MWLCGYIARAMVYLCKPGLFLKPTISQSVAWAYDEQVYHVQLLKAISPESVRSLQRKLLGVLALSEQKPNNLWVASFVRWWEDVHTHGNINIEISG